MYMIMFSVLTAVPIATVALLNFQPGDSQDSLTLAEERPELAAEPVIDEMPLLRVESIEIGPVSKTVRKVTC